MRTKREVEFYIKSKENEIRDIVMDDIYRPIVNAYVVKSCTLADDKNISFKQDDFISTITQLTIEAMKLRLSQDEQFKSFSCLLGAQKYIMSKMEDMTNKYIDEVNNKIQESIPRYEFIKINLDPDMSDGKIFSIVYNYFAYDIYQFADILFDNLFDHNITKLQLYGQQITPFEALMLRGRSYLEHFTRYVLNEVIRIIYANTNEYINSSTLNKLFNATVKDIESSVSKVITRKLSGYYKC